jgi:ribulose-5-phosphate 4-epimerase/fuculose-1-phosphate aldolase
LLTVGKTAAEAFLSMYILERACRIQILAQSGGGTLLPVSETILKNVAAQLGAVTLGQGAQLAWPGLLRKLDRIDPSYRE